MNIWEIAILKSINHLGGTASSQEIFKELESGKFIQLSDEHIRKTPWGSRPAYQNQVRSHLSNLIESGDIGRVERSLYKITQHGINRIDLI